MKKTFTATQEQKDAANTYVLCMAYTQTIRPVLEKIQSDLLEEYKIPYSFDKWERLTSDFFAKYGDYCKSWEDTWMIKDEDFTKVLSEYHARFTAEGFKVQELGFCPLLVAEDLERKARTILIDAMEPATGFKYDDFFNTTDWKENMDKYVDLTLRLLAPYLKNTLIKAA